MAEQADGRRMRLLEALADDGTGRELGHYARSLDADERTIRRDADYLHGLLSSLAGIEIRRGRVHGIRRGFGAGYFSDHVEQNKDAKEAVARRIVSSLVENLAIVITAGSSTYYVAREIRRVRLEEERPRGLIALTNSLPALMELIAGEVSTGVIGEVYNPDDCAFHTHELRTAFHPGLAIVGASGMAANLATGGIDLFSHRAEEAAFMKQLLAPVPEIAIALDSSKIGRNHPWSFTSGGILAGKTVRLYTHSLQPQQRDLLNQLTASAAKAGVRFSYDEAPNVE